MSVEVYVLLLQFTRLTKGQTDTRTDGFLMAILWVSCITMSCSRTYRRLCYFFILHLSDAYMRTADVPLHCFIVVYGTNL